jgi:hypothetical protein
MYLICVENKTIKMDNHFKFTNSVVAVPFCVVPLVCLLAGNPIWF